MSLFSVQSNMASILTSNMTSSMAPNMASNMETSISAQINLDDFSNFTYLILVLFPRLQFSPLEASLLSPSVYVRADPFPKIKISLIKVLITEMKNGSYFNIAMSRRMTFFCSNHNLQLVYTSASLIVYYSFLL